MVFYFLRYNFDLISTNERYFMFKKYFGITLKGKITKKINDFFVLFLQFKKLDVSNDVTGIIQNNLSSDIEYF